MTDNNNQTYTINQSFPNPVILLHPQIPKPLHLMNPRTVMGKEWWDRQRFAAYAKFDFHCHACGVPEREAWLHQWLEGHELYHYNYVTGALTFIGVAALCHACHNYIHKGRLNSMLTKGEIKDDYYNFILERGDLILDKSGLTGGQYPEITLPGKYQDKCSWGDWHLIIDGVNHGLRFSSFEEWSNHWNPYVDYMD